MSIEDHRVQFYLRHREQFAEWFELRAEVAVAVDEWLAEMGPHVEALATELGSEIECQVETGEDEAWPGLFLTRPAWRLGGKGSPRVGLQWTRRKTMLVGAAAPWVGVHADRKQAGGRAVFEDAAFQNERRSRKDGATPWWGAYRLVLPELPFPAQADEYRAMLVDAIRSAWLAYSSHVDAALGKAADDRIQTDGADGGIAPMTSPA